LMITRAARTAGSIAGAWLYDNENLPHDATLVLVTMSLVPEKVPDAEVIFAAAFVAASEDDRRAWMQWVGREAMHGRAPRDLVRRIATAARPSSDEEIEIALAASSGAVAPLVPAVIAQVEIDQVAFWFVEVEPGKVRLAGPIPHHAHALQIGPIVARVAECDASGAMLEGVGTMDVLAALRARLVIAWAQA
jgi:hypothetical protein